MRTRVTVSDAFTVILEIRSAFATLPTKPIRSCPRRAEAPSVVFVRKPTFPVKARAFRWVLELAILVVVAFAALVGQ